MADIKISELSQAESLSLSDLMESAIPYNGGFQSRRMTLAQLSNYLENSVLHNALDTTTKNIIGAINEILHDLANYYTTSQTYSKTEVDTLIAGVSGLHFEVVNALPTQDIDMNTIYLVPKQDSGQQDVYDEFICLDDTTTPATWEKIGTTEIDLSDYVTDTELATILNDYVTTSGLNTILQSYATTSAMTTALADKVDKVQGKGLSTEDYTTVEKAKLNGIEPSAQVNVQADWTETDASLDSYIWNKPNVNNVSIAQGTDFGGVLKPIAFTEFYSPTNENTYNHGIFRATDIWKNSNVKGTTSVIGQAHLYAGNWLTNGQEYNAKGYLGVYDESDHTAELTVNGTLTASRTYYLPDKDGTLALSEETVKWSEQNVLGAKNLLPFPYYNNIGITSASVTYTVDENGWIHCSGTSTGNSIFACSYREVGGGMFLPNGKYKISGCPSGGSESSSAGSYQIIVNATIGGAGVTYCYETGDGAEFTVNGDDFSNDGAWVCVRCVCRNRVVSDSLVFKPMVTLVTVKDNTYEPPANSNRQLTVDKVSWKSERILGAKNLLAYPYRENTTTKNGITFTVNDNGSVNVSSGSPSGNTNWYFANKKAFLPSGTYWVTGFNDTNQGDKFCLRVAINQDTSSQVTYNDYGDGVKISVSDGDVVSVYLHMASNGVSSGNNHFVMIRPLSVVNADYEFPSMSNIFLNKFKANKDLIAPTEYGVTASKAYTVGDYMFWLDGFYRVTQAMSAGDTITTSKVTSTTLGAELKRALS